MASHDSLVTYLYKVQGPDKSVMTDYEDQPIRRYWCRSGAPILIMRNVICSMLHTF